MYDIQRTQTRPFLEYCVHTKQLDSLSVQDSPVPLSYIPTNMLCSTPLASGMTQRNIPVVLP